MSSAKEVSYVDDADQERKYGHNESGRAEMCHLWCKYQGRGHLHTAICQHPDPNNTDLCKETENGQLVQKHCSESGKYGDDIDHGVDELLHSLYWKKIGFEDPYGDDVEMMSSFHKCKAICKHPDHKGDSHDEYCMLNVWHDPVKDDPEKENTIASGHEFSCKHAKPPHVYVHISKTHTVYVLCMIHLRVMLCANTVYS